MNKCYVGSLRSGGVFKAVAVGYTDLLDMALDVVDAVHRGQLAVCDFGVELPGADWPKTAMDAREWAETPAVRALAQHNVPGRPQPTALREGLASGQLRLQRW
ncbi:MULTISPECIES: hypothetical protein [Actinoalloteichus]|uniref:Uncharacterized protein n=1 Tax=Actinoalloteichus fjordicus TaxID=1612552 RepID=A0AAC9PSA2_9PSEU|nr:MULTISPECIES: hypothetical protein [Actinoalloteichus]APU15319.1 hypothetical protein UA74_16375 [Actinoalloteichus fjordicus]APU21388.1 hypothetical protein UA75_16920 [Actinoalloteichus sp. GBA129-24]